MRGAADVKIELGGGGGTGMVVFALFFEKEKK